MAKEEGTLIVTLNNVFFLRKICFLSRYVLSDTTQLRAKMMEMEQRIRELEDALAILQSTISSEPHPLLRDELLTIKFPPDRGTPLDKEEFRDRTSDIIDALGILTVGDQGVRYYGPSAGTEVRPLPMEDNLFSNSYLCRHCSWYSFILA